MEAGEDVVYKACELVVSKIEHRQVLVSTQEAGRHNASEAVGCKIAEWGIKGASVCN
jgi:hypothetical protein